MQAIDGFRLSPLQRRLWSLQRESAAYRSTCAISLVGKLDKTALSAAIQVIVDRHAILRTAFDCPVGMSMPVQIITDRPVAYSEVDLSLWRGEQQRMKVEQCIRQEADEPFDFTQGPPVRFYLLKLAADSHILVISLSPLCADFWTLKNLFREIAQSYGAFLNGGMSSDEPLQYIQVSEWQNELLEENDAKEGLAYWQGQQLEEVQPLSLAFESRLDEASHPYTFSPRHISVSISQEVLERIEGVAGDGQVSVPIFLQACWGVLLSRLAGQPDLVISTRSSGRKFSEMHEAFGLFTRYIPIRVRFAENLQFDEALERVNRAVRDAQAWEEYYVEDYVAQKNNGHKPRNSHPAAFEYEEWPDDQQTAGLKFSLYQQYCCTDQFGLKLNCLRSQDGLVAQFHYDPALYTAEAIQRVAEHFQALLFSTVEHPRSLISRLNLLSPAQRQQIVVDWNRTEVEFDREVCLHHLIEKQAQINPDAQAIADGQQVLTFSQVNKQANQLAHYLISKGVAPETIVAIYLERGVDMIVALLAAMKAGAAYLPLDPGQAKQRLTFMLGDARAAAVLTSSQLRERLPAVECDLINIGQDGQAMAAFSEANPEVKLEPENLAYVIYTSGSTGGPKGVMVQHRSVINLLKALNEAVYDGGRGRLKVGMNAPLAFDASVKQIVQMAGGHTLEVIPEEVRRDADKMVKYVEQSGIEALDCTPSQLKVLRESGLGSMPGKLKKVLVGGEAIEEGLWEELRNPSAVAYYNVYGPTECTVDAAVCEIGVERARPVIGAGIANVKLYILDDQQQVAPVGVTGELYIGGEGLARGYLNRADLTAEKFLPNPFSAGAGERMYRTGDLARWSAEGKVEYVGRADDQVKIRGYRVELGEIEGVLEEHEAVREAAVVLSESETGQKRLVGYVVLSRKYARALAAQELEEAADSTQRTQAFAASATGASQITLDQLTNFVKDRLPEYMVPSALVVLDEMPLTRNGKVDRQALPAPEMIRTEDDERLVAPISQIEEMLAGIWERVLGVDRVNITDNFFDLGGHSLLATQLISRVRESFRVEIALRGLFEAPTVSELAHLIRQAMRTGGGLQAPPIEKVSREQTLPLSFAQQRLWFLDQLEPDSAFYNIPTVLRLKGAFDSAAFERALSELVRRHEVLRTTFATVAGKPRQIINLPDGVAMPLIDLTGLAEDQREAEARRMARLDAQEPFDLARGPLLRVKLVRLAEQDYVTIVSMHHIVSDGWSTGLLIREVSALYNAYARGEESPLAELPVQYADYAYWQQQWLQGEVLEAELGYWKQQLAGAPAVLELPTDRPRPAMQTFRGDVEQFVLPADLTGRLRELSKREGVTLFMLLLTAFKALLYRYSGQEDIVVGTPIAGRNRGEIEELIGFFVNTLVLRTQVTGDLSFNDLLAQVKDVALSANAHQEVPFEKLVEELNPERSMSHSPIFQVMFTLQNTPTERLSLQGLSLGRMGSGLKDAKFDLSLTISDNQENLAGSFEYSTDLFDQETIARMTGHLLILLEAFVSDPHLRLSNPVLLCEEELQQVLVEWNRNDVDYPRESCIHELFERQAESTPEGIAVIYEDEQLTYSELNCRANQVAHYLQSLGVGRDELVGIYAERTLDMLVGLLAVLKAGAAYVPLDPAYPRDRIAYILADTRLAVVLTQQRFVQALADFDLNLVCLDASPERLADFSPQNLRLNVGPDNLAYVIYTSGSTGQPKGVMIEHRSLVNYSASAVTRFTLRPADRVLQFASISFDAAAEEIYPCLISGATLVLRPEAMLSSAEGFLLACRRLGLTVLDLPTAYFQHLVAELSAAALADLGQVRLVIIGGEKALADSVRRWQQAVAPSIRLINTYGPTEATIVATACDLEASLETTEVAIGRAVANVKTYVLDSELRPVPIGTAGELHIGGAGLARGYLRRPELTAEKFIADPFSRQAGGRLYRTGDVVRQRRDGQLEFLGRVDQQVKIRGFRIELGEIEAELRQHPAVAEAVVVVSDSESGNRRLVAYVVAERGYVGADEEAEAEPLQTRQEAQWRAVFDDLYREVDPEQQSGFYIKGWTSSYTGAAMADAEVREWVEQTLARVRSLGARRIYEIGCGGSGLMTLNLAAECEKYWATDLSRQSLRVLEHQVEKLGLKLPQVSYRQRAADDFTGVEAGEFEAVLVVSVAQYFPSIDYLKRVLEGAVAAVGDGGYVYLGDVRSLPLLEAFHASVQLERAPDEISVRELQGRVQEAVVKEKQLVVDPEFFEALRRELPRVRRVEVLLERGRQHNELSKYRYDVILHVGGEQSEAEAEEIREMSRMSWEKEGLTVAGLRRRLEAGEVARVVIDGVPNARVRRDVRLLEMLRGGEGKATVGEVKRALAAAGVEGVDPEDLWEMGERLGYEVEISWAESRADGRYEVVMWRGDQAPGAARRRARWGQRRQAAVVERAWQKYANTPLRGMQVGKLSQAIRERLRERLPEYMVPWAIVMLDEMPLTRNGKLDRKALPNPEPGKAREGEGRAVRGGVIEEVLAAIWGKVLGVEEVGRDDHFFELGGHSLLATQVVSRVREAFKVELALRRLFEKPRLSELAADIEAAMQEGEGLQRPALERRGEGGGGGETELSYAQERLWFLDQLQPGNPSFNNPTALRLVGALDTEALRQALTEIVRRHEILRTTFPTAEGQPVQVISPAQRLELPLLDLSGLPQAERERQAKRLAQEEKKQPFDLAQGPLLRVKLVRLAEREHIVLFTLHHIVSDGWSVGVLAREVRMLYEAFRQGRSSPLPELPIQYADYAAWQRRWLQGEVLKSQLDYWKINLKGAPALLRLPTDRPRPAIQTTRGASVPFELSRAATDALKHLCKQQGSTLYMTLLAAFQTLLHYYSEQQDVVVGSPIAGRNSTETEQLIGLFLNNLALRTSFAGDPTFIELLERVREMTLNAYLHQDAPFQQVVEAVQPERSLNHSPLFQVWFVLQNTPDQQLGLEGLEMSLLEGDTDTVQFDLELLLAEYHEGIRGSLKYNRDLFDEGTINRIVEAYAMLIDEIIRQPESQVSTLEERLKQEEKQQREDKRRQREEAARKKLVGFKPKALRLTKREMVKTSYFDEEKRLPLVIGPEIEGVSLSEWVASNRDYFQAELIKHGAMLLRGFNIGGVAEFEQLVKSVSSDLIDYYERSVERTKVGEKIYTSSEYPASHNIPFHNEYSYSHNWPMRLWFYCEQAARQGGETPIADSRRVNEMIAPELRERFMKKKVMYVRNFGDHLDLPWQSVFQTEDKQEVEKYCEGAGIECEWKSGDRLRTRQVRQAVAQHPGTGEQVWFNQAHLFHLSSLEPAVKESLSSYFKDDEFPRNAFYGDGTAIEAEEIEQIRQAYEKASVSFRWQDGDIVVLENMLVAHARAPFVGPRRILVAMTDLFNNKDARGI